MERIDFLGKPLGESTWDEIKARFFALDAERQRLREQLDVLATSLEQSVARNKQGPDMGWTHPDEPADQLRREVGYVIEDARAALGVEGEQEKPT
jgi:hypothetical protein